ncbi:TPA: YSIRK-type signal peptide-containing protein [Streptococcus equi subsp. zooepidemicus]|nr:YSIRK-type signal peptide-containing protein [Streptococcus equi subsp. zooepidemicus]
MEKKERFSLRKYKSGMVSVLIGILFLTGIGSVAAEEQGVSSAHVSAGQHQESREVLSVSQASEGAARTSTASQVKQRKRQRRQWRLD